MLISDAGFRMEIDPSIAENDGPVVEEEAKLSSPSRQLEDISHESGEPQPQARASSPPRDNRQASEAPALPPNSQAPSSQFLESQPILLEPFNGFSDDVEDASFPSVTYPKLDVPQSDALHSDVSAQGERKPAMYRIQLRDCLVELEDTEANSIDILRAQAIAEAEAKEYEAEAKAAAEAEGSAEHYASEEESETTPTKLPTTAAKASSPVLGHVSAPAPRNAVAPSSKAADIPEAMSDASHDPVNDDTMQDFSPMAEGGHDGEEEVDSDDADISYSEGDVGMRDDGDELEELGDDALEDENDSEEDDDSNLGSDEDVDEDVKEHLEEDIEESVGEGEEEDVVSDSSESAFEAPVKKEINSPTRGRGYSNIAQKLAAKPIEKPATTKSSLKAARTSTGPPPPRPRIARPRSVQPQSSYVIPEGSQVISLVSSSPEPEIVEDYAEDSIDETYKEPDLPSGPGWVSKKWSARRGGNLPGPAALWPSRLLRAGKD